LEITEFIAAQAGTPPRPGACCRIVDDWIYARLGYSALARYGREYTTNDDVAKWLEEPGGLAVAVNRVMRACGIAKTREPRAGDVGLVAYAGLLRMAIHTGNAWISRDDKGFVAAPLTARLKAWRIE
jgi:hypothetical protein